MSPAGIKGKLIWMDTENLVLYVKQDDGSWSPEHMAQGVTFPYEDIDTEGKPAVKMSCSCGWSMLMFDADAAERTWYTHCDEAITQDSKRDRRF